MSIPAINWCIEQNDLPPGEWVVLFHLSHCHNHETGRCDPSQEYLSKMLNMGERTVRRHLSNLELKGRITRKKRGIEGGGRVSDYYTLGHEPAKLAANLTGQSMRTNRPIHAENVHEMAGKQEVTGIEQEVPPVVPQPPPEAKPKKRAVAIPENWVPNEANVDHALSKNLTYEEIQNEADQFRDYHLARGTTFKDWNAGWRTWVANAIKYRNRGMAGKAPARGHGQGGGIAGVVARRQLGGQG